MVAGNMIDPAKNGSRYDRFSCIYIYIQMPRTVNNPVSQHSLPTVYLVNKTVWQFLTVYTRSRRCTVGQESVVYWTETSARPGQRWPHQWPACSHNWPALSGPPPPPTPFVQVCKSPFPSTHPVNQSFSVRGAGVGITGHLSVVSLATTAQWAC